MIRSAFMMLCFQIYRILPEIYRTINRRKSILWISLDPLGMFLRCFFPLKINLERFGQTNVEAVLKFDSSFPSSLRPLPALPRQKPTCSSLKHRLGAQDRGTDHNGVTRCSRCSACRSAHFKAHSSQPRNVESTHNHIHNC